MECIDIARKFGFALLRYEARLALGEIEIQDNRAVGDQRSKETPVDTASN